jgi:hypothetical protein
MFKAFTDWSATITRTQKLSSCPGDNVFREHTVIFFTLSFQNWAKWVVAAPWVGLDEPSPPERMLSPPWKFSKACKTFFSIGVKIGVGWAQPTGKEIPGAASISEAQWPARYLLLFYHENALKILLFNDETLVRFLQRV